MPSTVSPPIWVFGYGSLIWRPDFPFVDRAPASVDGWARRFWQGSHDHRGTPDSPGRVVTLVPRPNEVCQGMAYRLADKDAPQILRDLDHREKNGYERHDLTLNFGSHELVGMTYLAAEGNFAYAGPMPMAALAALIANSQGPSGSNADYLLELANVLTEMGIEDAHVQDLAERVGGMLKVG